jgi:AraC-like DNA-binding protein
MNHAYLRPRPPLDAFVHFFWATDRYVAATPRERVLPDGSLAIVVHLGSGPMRVSVGDRTEPASVGGAALCGARTSPLLLDTSALGPTVGIHFRAGGVRPFFDVQAEELAERVTPLDALWGGAVQRLREQLTDVHEHLQRAQIMERFLLQQLRRPLNHRHALRASLTAFEEPDLPSVAEVNRRTGLSPKRLLALFREEIGLCPKSYWRVRRFRAALHDLERGVLRGAPLAAHHGYCDQAHFLREFRSLAGSSPREYLSARVPETDHVSVNVQP